MSKSVNKYRIFCNTENKYTYRWDDAVPTKCPIDGAHTIDTNTISITFKNDVIIFVNVASNSKSTVWRSSFRSSASSRLLPSLPPP
jgi:hypothetical protein